MTLVLTVPVLAFYTWNPKARNYGGSTQGLRWLFWLIPFWLLLLPRGSSAARIGSSWVRGLRWRSGLGPVGRLRDANPGATPGSSTGSSTWASTRFPADPRVAELRRGFRELADSRAVKSIKNLNLKDYWRLA